METKLNLGSTRDLAIVGNGNIFCDIARVLLKDPSEFEKTEMHPSVVD